MTIYVLSFLFSMNFAFAKEVPHKKIILLQLSNAVISQNKTIYSGILNLNACDGKNPTLPRCYLLLSQLNNLPNFKYTQLNDVKDHINAICSKKIRNIFTLAQLYRLKTTKLNPYCDNLISKKIELIKYKSVDP